ncbi:UNVERIFIED_CONTAM: hypothetical protein RMT77_017104 [Armadillidium vulgare]
MHDKAENKCWIVEVGVPSDGGVSAYEREKGDQVPKIKYEIKRTWNIEVVEIVFIIVGATGIIKKSLVEYLERIPIQISTIELSKIAIKKSICISNQKRYLATHTRYHMLV